MTEPAPVNAAPVENGVATSPEEQPGTKVFAGNLAYTTTDESLKNFFSPVADDIVSAQVIFRGTRSAGYGFVAFKTAEAAQKAVDLLNKKELDGRTLIVEVAKPTEEKTREKKQRRVPKKRVSKKPKSANGDATNTEATENKEPSVNADAANDTAKPKKKRTTRKTKKAKAPTKDGETTVTNGDDTTPAPSSDAKPKKAKTPKAPKERKPPRPVGEAPAGEPSKTMLFVANLGFSVDDAALSELFTSNGITVVSARVVLRRWGHPRRSKGYGFVDVGSEEEQKKALEALQGKEVGGREIAVKIAVNAQEKEAREGAEAVEGGPNPVPSLIAA